MDPTLFVGLPSKVQNVPLACFERPTATRTDVLQEFDPCIPLSEKSLFDFDRDVLAAAAFQAGELDQLVERSGPAHTLCQYRGHTIAEKFKLEIDKSLSALLSVKIATSVALRRLPEAIEILLGLRIGACDSHDCDEATAVLVMRLAVAD